MQIWARPKHRDKTNHEGETEFGNCNDKLQTPLANRVKKEQLKANNHLKIRKTLGSVDWRQPTARPTRNCRNLSKPVQKQQMKANEHETGPQPSE